MAQVIKVQVAPCVTPAVALLFGMLKHQCLVMRVDEELKLGENVHQTFDYRIISPITIGSGPFISNNQVNWKLLQKILIFQQNLGYFLIKIGKY